MAAFVETRTGTRLQLDSAPLGEVRLSGEIVPNDAANGLEALLARHDLRLTERDDRLLISHGVTAP